MDAMQVKDSGKDQGLSESRFYMWRTVFAVAHADNFLALEEQGMLAGYLDRLPLSAAQLATLREDMATPQRVEDMFARVGDTADQDEFFDIVRKLVWSDGRLDEREKALVERLEGFRRQAATSSAKAGGFLRGLIDTISGKAKAR